MPRKRLETAKLVPTRKRATKRLRKVDPPASLPPQVISATPSAAVTPSPKRDRTILPPNSVVREKVMGIIAMRVAGRSNAEIAEALGIKETSIRQYLFLAGRNGWLKKRAVDPADRMEFEVIQKVVRNLDEMLDSDNEQRRDVATLKTAEGMLFKRAGDAAATAPPPLTMIGLRIEMPTGASTTVREGTTGGVPRFSDGEVVDGATVVTP